MLLKLSNWCYQLTAPLSTVQMQQMLRCEHGGLNEVFAELALQTGEKKYLELAIRFSDKKILNPLLFSADSLTGLHANTQIPKVIGYAAIAGAGGDRQWMEAAAFFWQTVVNNRTVSIGGNSVREHFHPANNFSTMIETREGPETCNTYNMLKLSKRLFINKPNGSYVDYYERALYNHILSSQHPEGGFVYFTPMRPGFEIHDSRYMIYWRTTNKAGFQQLKQQSEREEKETLQLEATTLDYIPTGEQQPELDHQLQGEQTETGLYKEMHWRRSLNWFSYQLRNKENAAKTLRITYHGGERNTVFDIYINNQLLKNVQPDALAGDKFIDVNYSIPGYLLNTGETITVKFVAKPGAATARIFGIRLLSKE